jgi:hypothetical protein
LFLPMKTMVDGELHEGGSTSFTLVVLPMASCACFRRRGPIRCPVFMCECSDGFAGSGDGFTQAPNIFPAGYEFESDKAAIS